MKSYIYESVKLPDGKRYITRLTPSEYVFNSIIKFLFCLFIVWPLQIFFFYPFLYTIKVLLIICEFILRGIWWLIKLPFCLIFKKTTPQF